MLAQWYNSTQRVASTTCEIDFTEMNLCLVLCSIEGDVVELESVGRGGGGNDTVGTSSQYGKQRGKALNAPEPFPHHVLLEELLGEVLDVPLGEGDVGLDGELSGS
jgi:hypothetical protein